MVHKYLGGNERPEWHQYPGERTALVLTGETRPHTPRGLQALGRTQI